jgi:YD repeat-containing protein
MNKIKKTTTFSTQYQRTGFDKDDITPIQCKELEVEYNEAGKAAKETHFSEDGEVDSYTLNEYDDRGRLVSSVQYDADEILCQQTTQQYDEEGHLVCQGNIYGEGSPEYLTKFVYENGLLMRQDSYDEDDFDFTEKEFAYDSEGRLTKEIDYSDDGEVLYAIENQYNEKGLLSQMIRNEVAAKDRRTYQFAYDERGNKVKDLVYNYNEELIAKAYYTYNDDDQPLEVETEDLDRYQKATYTYEGAHLVEEALTDKDGNVLSKTTYHYNEQDDIDLITRYIRDEVDNNELRVLSETQYEREYYA